MNIRKAVITTAGFGTRFLPISKTIQKEMLPIINRPIVDYVVEDCVRAGIEEIIFVVSEHNKQILHFYSENKRLHAYLEKMGKLDRYEKVANIHNQAKFTFVQQRDDDAYGTAVPVQLCKEHLENEEAFLVFMGDDFIYWDNGHSEAESMIELFKQSQAAGLATFIERPESVLHRYGVAEVEKRNGHQFLVNLVEKPEPGTAPSNLSNISKYILTPEVFAIIDQQKVNPQSGELYITDTVLELAKQSSVVIYTPRGEYLDGGNELSWLKANLRVAKDQPKMKEELTRFIKEEFLK